ncbi:MAG: cupin [Robiginitomaculum sp.]|nr:MAG: cupin [Robiginitomaculum sp.]
MTPKANIPDALDALSEHWSQKTLAEANGNLFKVAKGLGATHWHKHENQDELFIIYEGRMRIEMRDRNIELGVGDIFTVPRGVEHRPVADDEVKFLVVGLNITSTKAGGKPNL